MKHDISITFLVFVLVGLGSWAARTWGYYDAYWFTDVILHILSGIGFGFIWTAITQRTSNGKVGLIIGAAAFAVLGSFLWEVWEYAGWQVLPGNMRAYVPELGDSLGDIFCGLLGGVIVGAWSRIRN